MEILVKNQLFGTSEIVEITMGMIQKDVSWQNDQSAQAIRDLETLQKSFIQSKN